MAVVIRLSRVGTNNRPFFHIVAADSTKPRDGRYLEKLGTYDPKKKEAKEKVVVNLEAFQAWVKKGAQPSETVGKIVKAVTVTK